MVLSLKKIIDRHHLRDLLRIIPILLLPAVIVNDATASTATYVEPSSLDNGELFSLSSSTDSAGVFLGLGDTLALQFATPFGTSRNDRVTIFTLPPTQGVTIGRIRFGSYNDGAPTFVRTRRVRFGRAISSGNLFARGCSALGGCDYVEITVTRTRRGSTGAEVDYVDTNGVTTTVTAPSPEPQSWILMISGFFLVAWRMKKQRTPQQAAVAA